MNKHKHNQSGFSVVEFLILVTVIGVLSGIGWYAFGRMRQNRDTVARNTNSESKEAAQLMWQQSEGGWQSTGTPPKCPEQPIMKMPVEVGKVASVLYPGQLRGGNYKPHGGFRFDDSSNNSIEVKAPVDGFVVRGSQYLEKGEPQYSFDFFNNCGVMYRFDHLATLSEKLKQITSNWSAPQEGDSRTQQVSPAVLVKQGEVIATSIGFTKPTNVFLDWGVYDFRQENSASKASDFQNTHQQDKELSWHAVCWFDWLPASDSTLIKSLPAGDPTSGKTSDYCQ